MNTVHTMTGFTLFEILIAMALLTIIASFFGFESISSFQLALHRLHSQEEVLWQEARAGAALRHMASSTKNQPYE